MKQRWWLFSVAFLAACGAGADSLLPAGSVTVYADANCGSVIGTTSQPLAVLAIEYPDKTDYRVRVRYEGRDGYVCGGNFRLQ